MRLRPPLPRGSTGSKSGKKLLDAWPFLITLVFIALLGTTRRVSGFTVLVHVSSTWGPAAWSAVRGSKAVCLQFSPDPDEDGPGGIGRPSRSLAQPGRQDADCSCRQQQDLDIPAPRFCRLGLPTAALQKGKNQHNGVDLNSATGVDSSGTHTKHKLAVIIPYRNRELHVSTLLSKLHPYLQSQGVDFDSFIIEQGDGYLFNRGALLNVGALLLQGSNYDHYVFQDADTIPKGDGGILYSFPQGRVPLHLTPYGIHPKANYEDFFGGIVIYTVEQLQAVNGFGTQFWGWGREDDNMRERLVRAGMWPPEKPNLSDEDWRRIAGGAARLRASQSRFFEHQAHKQASELRGREVEGSMVFFEEHPAKPYAGAKIMSSQPNLLQDFATGLNTTQFRVMAVQPYAEAVKYTVELYCNTEVTPWCLPSAISQQPLSRGSHAVDAVASGITRR